MSEANVALVRHLFSEWNEHRSGGIAERFQRDVELDASDLPQPDFQGVYRGLEEFGHRPRTWLSAWDNHQAEPIWVEARGPRVVAWLRMHLVGRHSGVTGDACGGWGFTFRDGKVSHIQLYVDEDEARRSLDE